MFVVWTKRADRNFGQWQNRGSYGTEEVCKTYALQFVGKGYEIRVEWFEVR